MSEILLKEREGKVLILTINRPKALNAINTEVMDALKAIFVDGEEDMTGVHAIILKGSGEKAFAAGADIMEFPSFTSKEGRALSAKGHGVYNAIERFHIPVIAMIKGYALGGGCELTMACHLRVAEDCAKFGQPEINLGVVPGYGGSQRLVRYIGKSKAMELLLTGSSIDASTAEMLGLVCAVAPSGQGMEVAMKLANKIASKSPLVVGRMIALVNDYGNDGFDKEIELFGQSFDSYDLKEGVAAFMEKRKANFIGK
jgi:enoyl-CoA hydratase